MQNNRIKHINLDQLGAYSVELAKSIELSQYIPEHIVYIERAGLFIGVHISKYFNASMSGIHATRSGNKFKSMIGILLRFFPNFITDFLRRIEENSGLHNSVSERKVAIESTAPPLSKKILIVDDAVDTGNTLKSVYNHLITLGIDKNNIKIAALTTTKPKLIVEPDFTLFKETSCAFPWSYASKEYNKSWKLFENLKRELKSKS